MSLPKTIASFVGDSVLVDIDELHWFQGELKSLDKADFDKLRTSIIEEGVIDTVNVWENEKKQLMILDGHQTKFVLNSLRADGYSIPKVKATKILAPNFKKAKAYVLLMSSTYGKLSGESLSQYFIDAELDFTELSKKLDLPGVDLDLEDFNVSGGTEGLTDEDEIPEVVEPKAKRGDIYKLGNHRLMCGDSTSEADVSKLMDGEKADMVFTDPPYGMFLDTDYTSMDSGMGKNKKFKPVTGDNEDFVPDLINTIFASFSYCKEMFLFGADYYAELIPDRNNGSWVIWDKSVTESMDKGFGSAWESCWSKAKHKRTFARILWRGLYGKKDDQKTRTHPTQKPVHLAEFFFENWGKQTRSVVDIYGGSGSTLIACEKTNRKCYMMELDPHYIDVIIARWEAFTGETAELISQSES